MPDLWVDSWMPGLIQSSTGWTWQSNSFTYMCWKVQLDPLSAFCFRPFLFSFISNRFLLVNLGSPYHDCWTDEQACNSLQSQSRCAMHQRRYGFWQSIWNAQLDKKKDYAKYSRSFFTVLKPSYPLVKWDSWFSDGQEDWNAHQGKKKDATQLASSMQRSSNVAFWGQRRQLSPLPPNWPCALPAFADCGLENSISIAGTEVFLPEWGQWKPSCLGENRGTEQCLGASGGQLHAEAVWAAAVTDKGHFSGGLMKGASHPTAAWATVCVRPGACGFYNCFIFRPIYLLNTTLPLSSALHPKVFQGSQLAAGPSFEASDLGGTVEGPHQDHKRPRSQTQQAAGFPGSLCHQPPCLVMKKHQQTQTE